MANVLFLPAIIENSCVIQCLTWMLAIFLQTQPQTTQKNNEKSAPRCANYLDFFSFNLELSKPSYERVTLMYSTPVKDKCACSLVYVKYVRQIFV